MRGNMGNLGTDHLLENDASEAQYERARGWMRHAKGLLKILALGLMLACGTAYASEPASPVPVTMAKNKVNRPDSTPNLASAAVGDDITDWSIAILAIIAGMFFAINFFDSRKNDR